MPFHPLRLSLEDFCAKSEAQSKELHTLCLVRTPEMSGQVRKSLHKFFSILNGILQKIAKSEQDPAPEQSHGISPELEAFVCLLIPSLYVVSSFSASFSHESAAIRVSCRGAGGCLRSHRLMDLGTQGPRPKSKGPRRQAMKQCKHLRRKDWTKI